MTAHRPLLTAVAAGSLLCAVWFMPSAHATAERPGTGKGDTARSATLTAGDAGAPATPASPQPLLAASGGVDTTPYVFGGVAFVAAGGALVTAAVRRSRTADR
ncbi:LPXTG-domain-containing protein cell wall anchor domain protein [Streptomyces eurocidicus]|uniref:LPXTG-domain-containing protein cell wall anchor domain protein n=1 Tax=Streptomyces eurocidicus TaxID=66423 RepID=A0A2N8NP97_STREU|nr:hypothetical protein [Streptomyces eurocidicus]MBB5117323.1 hypothetical protein [Streptomyces eurocidicus]MBF6056198.1 hypothetical protein [Streptomyces eurocidicus]PNE30584.1 LPXTG-domain-containing protein cell wall anchor domain protein [Streptomyces eurocidicus]